MTAPVDVLAVMVTLCSHGGTIEERRIIPAWNKARSTGTIASHLRPHSTAAVRRALLKAEKAGDVIACGTGAQHCTAWNKSAAQERELYWAIHPAALARCGGVK